MDDWREVVTQAALEGRKQTYGRMHDTDGQGECVMGLLHLTMHENREAAISCIQRSAYDLEHGKCLDRLHERYQLTYRNAVELMKANDEGQDFLTIARKALS